MKSRRVFIALPLSAGIGRNLRGLQSRLLESLGPGWRAVEEAAFHITLRFLGETDDATLARVCTLVADATHGIAPFGFRLDGVGVFPRPAAARVLWVGVAGDVAPLHELARRIEDGCRGLGFAAEAKAYHPHVTLARVERKGPAPAPAPIEAAVAEWSGREIAKVFAREIITYESLLKPDGPEYVPLATATLTP